MSNKDKSKKHLLWMIGFVVCVFTACLIFFLNQRETRTKGVDESNTAETQPADNDMQEVRQTIGSVSMPTGHAPPNMEEVVWEKPEEEPEEDSVEAQWLANWKANFPYKPTTDPDVIITQEMLEDGDPTVEYNHMFLRSFFESESRFTPQFEQLYRILEEHDRGDNPVAAGKIFDSLRQYHRHLQKDPEGQSTTYSHRLERRRTNAEVAEMFKEAIVYTLHAERRWPDREFMPEDEAIAIRDRIVNEIQGMEEMPDPGFSSSNGYREELEVGFSPLMISPGWQSAYDKWNAGWNAIEAEERKNRQLSVGKGNVLLANGKPIVYDKREHVASITTPDGFQVPLNLDADGKVIIPTPAEIEQMKANGEGEWVELPERPAAQTPLTEEEWKMQAEY